MSSLPHPRSSSHKSHHCCEQHPPEEPLLQQPPKEQLQPKEPLPPKEKPLHNSTSRSIVSSCVSLQVAQNQTREGRTCITTICPPSRTEISLLTCAHKELFDIEIGSSKGLPNRAALDGGAPRTKRTLLGGWCGRRDHAILGNRAARDSDPGF
ncbi:hypothetical protein QTO34_016948 [Cnephaeus nilssonii]|uniref:Uncharacterized protein n=1 Tax=Cnephaeus nilssonii TaxID=3371016 RepID=A0AA40I366_CNENI|nr:hypothetical protein QTO34_016948 [Eptesicus nilssonii]